MVKLKFEIIISIDFQFDEGRNDLASTIDENTIREFIQANQLPIVVDFNAEV